MLRRLLLATLILTLPASAQRSATQRDKALSDLSTQTARTEALERKARTLLAAEHARAADHACNADTYDATYEAALTTCLATFYSTTNQNYLHLTATLRASLLVPGFDDDDSNRHSARLLSTSEIAWRIFRDQSCAASEHSGSISAQTRILCKIHLTRDHMDDLAARFLPNNP